MSYSSDAIQQGGPDFGPREKENKGHCFPSSLPKGSFQDVDQGGDSVMAAVTRTAWMGGFNNKSFS